MSEGDKYEVLEKIGEFLYCAWRTQQLTVYRTWFLWSYQEGAQEAGWPDPLSQGDQLLAHVAEGTGTAPRRVCDSLLTSTSKHCRILPPRALENNPGSPLVHGILREWGLGARYQRSSSQETVRGGRLRLEHVFSAGYCSLQMSLWR
jgi:hypothetical protein